MGTPLSPSAHRGSSTPRARRRSRPDVTARAPLVPAREVASPALIEATASRPKARRKTPNLLKKVPEQNNPHAGWGWIYSVICAPEEAGEVCWGFVGPLAEGGGTARPGAAALTG